jgi:hypothetical protein
MPVKPHVHCMVATTHQLKPYVTFSLSLTPAVAPTCVCSYLYGGQNSSLPNNGAIYPCGLIAHSFFNDTLVNVSQTCGQDVQGCGSGTGAQPYCGTHTLPTDVGDDDILSSRCHMAQ